MCIRPAVFPGGCNCNKTETERQTDRPTAASSCSVCSLRLPRSTNALSAGTWDECSTCAHIWQGIAVFTQELSPTDWAVFWHSFLLQFSLSYLLRLRENRVALQSTEFSLFTDICWCLTNKWQQVIVRLISSTPQWQDKSELRCRPEKNKLKINQPTEKATVVKLF